MESIKYEMSCRKWKCQQREPKKRQNNISPFPMPTKHLLFHTFADNLIRIMNDVSMKWSNFLLNRGGLFAKRIAHFAFNFFFSLLHTFSSQKRKKKQQLFNDLIKSIYEEFLNDRIMVHRTLKTIFPTKKKNNNNK